MKVQYPVNSSPPFHANGGPMSSLMTSTDFTHIRANFKMTSQRVNNNNNLIVAPPPKTGVQFLPRSPTTCALPRQNAMLCASRSPPVSPGSDSANSSMGPSFDASSPPPTPTSPLPPCNAPSTGVTPPFVDAVPLSTWHARLEHAIPCETLLRQRLNSLCATGGGVYPTDTAIPRSHPTSDMMKTLLKLHEPYLKLYIEEFYKQMKKTCVETLTAMFVHYEGALQWMRHELSTAIEKLTKAILQENFILQKKATTAPTEPSCLDKATADKLDLQKLDPQKLDPGAKFTFNVEGKENDSKTTTDETEARQGRQPPTGAADDQEGESHAQTLKLAEYVLHLHRKVQTLEAEAAAKRRQQDQLSMLCALATKRLETHESEQTLAWKTQNATRIRHMTSGSSEERSSTGNGTTPPLTSHSRGMTLSPSPPSTSGGGTLARTGGKIKANASATSLQIQTLISSQFRRRTKYSRQKSASETNLFETGNEGKDTKSGGRKKSNTIIGSNEPPIDGYGDGESASSVTSSFDSNWDGQSGCTEDDPHHGQGRVITPHVLTAPTAAARSGWSLPGSRTTSIDGENDERIQSLPVIELPDGLFDTVKRRKRASKDGDTPKRGTIANMRSSVSSAADDADSADLRKRRGSEDILDGSGYNNNNNNNNNGSDVQRREQTDTGNRDRKNSWRRSMPALFNGLKMKFAGSMSDLRGAGLKPDRKGVLPLLGSSTDSAENDHTLKEHPSKATSKSTSKSSEVETRRKNNWTEATPQIGGRRDKETKRKESAAGKETRLHTEVDYFDMLGAATTTRLEAGKQELLLGGTLAAPAPRRRLSALRTDPISRF